MTTDKDMMTVEEIDELLDAIPEWQRLGIGATSAPISREELEPILKMARLAATEVPKLRRELDAANGCLRNGTAISEQVNLELVDTKKRIAELEAERATLSAQVARLRDIVDLAIEWDGTDATGEHAVWLEAAETVLADTATDADGE